MINTNKEDNKNLVEKNNNRKKEFLRQLPLQAMVIPGIIFMIIFCYVPMYGITIAFKDYTVLDTITSAPWVGLDNFRIFFNDPKFWQVAVNTVAISFGKLMVSFPLAIILALLINELRHAKVKKITQTISYLPHFLSWVILGGMVITWLSEQGLLNNILVNFGFIDKPIPFMIEPQYYWGIAILSDVWKEVGWGTILYLAAMSGIDPTLYEAARVDGASRIRQIWNITLPSIRGIITLMFVLAMGGLMSSNLDQTLVLQNALNISRSEVIDSYVYKLGLMQGDFAYAAAVGLFTSVISIILVLLMNYLTKKFNDRSIF